MIIIVAILNSEGGLRCYLPILLLQGLTAGTQRCNSPSCPSYIFNVVGIEITSQLESTQDNTSQLKSTHSGQPKKTAPTYRWYVVVDH